MKAISKSDYRETWASHIKQLAILGLAADVPYDEYKKLIDQLNSWLDRATDNQNLPE